jgi:uncharacterized OB-fold protein
MPLDAAGVAETAAPTQRSPDQEYRDFLAQGRFMIQRFRASGRWVFYPRLAEPASGDSEFEWQEPSGFGSVYSVTIVRPRPPDEPYTVALIDLAEGPRMMSTVEGVAPERVAIGMRVQAHVVHRAGTALVVFTPAGDD